MSKLLIDGDVLVYRAGFAAEKTNYLVTELRKIVAETATAADAKELVTEGRLLWSRKVPDPVEKAITIIDVMIADIRARFAGMKTEVYLSGVGNYRYGIATRKSYKGNRDTPKPVHSKALVEHLVKRGAIVSAGEEADDMLGIAATSNPGSVIASVDKDLLQIPGKHYDFVTKEEVRSPPRKPPSTSMPRYSVATKLIMSPGSPGLAP